MSRRKEYLPIGKNPEYNVYHSKYDALRISSDILNSGNKKPSVHTVLWDKHNVEAELYAILGDSEGEIINDSGLTKPAEVPRIKNKLERLEKRFLNYQQEMINSGHHKPDRMPTAMMEEKLTLLATLDVLQEETEVLKKHLKTFTDKEEEIDDEQVLRSFPCGVAKFWGNGAKNRRLINVLKIIDGQKVELINDLLVITDTRSPYRGMAVADYRAICILFQKERKTRRAELMKQREMEIKKTGASGIKIPTFGRIVNRASLPKWPGYAKNHLEPVESDSSHGKIRRKKD